MKCSKCNKEKDESSFQVKTKTYKSCFECREQSRKWREKNKERVAEYNKFTLQSKKSCLVSYCGTVIQKSECF